MSRALMRARTGIPHLDLGLQLNDVDEEAGGNVEELDPTELAPREPEAPTTRRGFFSGTRFASMAAMITGGAAAGGAAGAGAAAIAPSTAATGGTGPAGLTTIAVGPAQSSASREGSSARPSDGGSSVRNGSGFGSAVRAPSTDAASSGVQTTRASSGGGVESAAAAVAANTTAAEIDVTDAPASPPRAVSAAGRSSSPPEGTAGQASSSGGDVTPGGAVTAAAGGEHSVMMLMSAMMSPATSPPTSANGSPRVGGFEPSPAAIVIAVPAVGVLASAVPSIAGSTIDHETVTVDALRSTQAVSDDDGRGSRAVSRARRSPTPGLVVSAEAVAANAPRRHSLVLPPLPGAILSPGPPLAAGGGGDGALDGGLGASSRAIGFAPAMSSTYGSSMDGDGGSSRGTRIKEETVVEDEDNDP